MGNFKKYFRPQKDITAYEVAYILGHCTGNTFASMWTGGMIFSPEQWESIPVEMERHFSDQG